MKKSVKYCFLLVLSITGCEDIYTADIESRENVIVADARIVVGMEENLIRLITSLGFNEELQAYPAINGATVSIVANNNSEFVLPEVDAGVFHVNFPIDSGLEYMIRINYKGDTFESGFEVVPNVPVLDSIYGFAETKVYQVTGDNDVDNFRERDGFQMYADITNEEELPFYRFTARKISQFTYTVQIVFMGELIDETMYAWHSYFPQGLFNIASPPDFSVTNSIIKHPLFFLQDKPVSSGQFFAGWILILYQYGLSESAHSFYKDLNSQLDSDGKLFDPLYVQARNNLKCVNNPEQIILGNFEISTIKERRYFVQFISDEEGYLIKPIPYFYQIPYSGEQLYSPPDFWEHRNKIYPDE